MTSMNEVRFRLDMRAVDTQQLLESKGYTLTLSETGSQVVGDSLLSEGQQLELRMYVPDLDWPIRIDYARVAWIKGGNFGLDFVHLPPNDLARLRETATKLETANIE